MSKSSVAIVILAASAVLLRASPTVAEQLCKPSFRLNATSFSDAVNLTRIWRARFDVDASRCTRNIGLFAIEFLRAMENGVDEDVVEPFIWRHGVTDVRVNFWHDEAVHDFRVVEISPCECRINPRAE